jgi:hypothetical protein
MRVQNPAISTSAPRKPNTPSSQAEARFTRRLGMAKRPGEEHGIDAAGAQPPAGGPLGLHRAPDAPSRVEPLAGPQAAQLVDRLMVGQTRDGLPEVRMDVAVGALRGTEVRLTAGRAGLEATFVTATEAARRVVEAQLADLARALEARGVNVARCDVVVRGSRSQAAAARLDRDERAARGSWEDVLE